MATSSPLLISPTATSPDPINFPNDVKINDWIMHSLNDVTTFRELFDVVLLNDLKRLIKQGMNYSSGIKHSSFSPSPAFQL